MRAAQLQGLPVARLMVLACALGGACAGLAGTIEVAAEIGRANASLNAGYGYTGILIAFLARFNPLAIMPMALLLGGLTAAGGLLQRHMDLPDATVQVLQGMIFVAILTSETLYGRIGWFQPQGHGLMEHAVGTVLIAMLAGSLRVSTPFLFVSLGECLTEKSGRINLGNEGVLVMGAMVGYAISYETGNPWVGVLAAACAGMLLGGLHGAVCSLARVNDVAMGIAIMLAGTGIAFFFGKPFVAAERAAAAGDSAGFLVRIAAGAAARCMSARCSSWAWPRHWRCTGSCVRRGPGCGCASSATARTPPWRWACRSTASDSWPPPAAARWPGSAAPSCRCTTPAVGTRGCRPARG